MHSTDKQIESIINWRMRTDEKEKAVKSAENFFAQHGQKIESFINWRMRTYEKEKAVKSAEKFFAQQTNKLNQL